MRILKLWFWKKYGLYFIIFLLLLSVVYKFSIEAILVSLFLTWAFSVLRSFLRRKKREKYRVRHVPRHFKKPKKFTKINLNYLPIQIKQKAHHNFNRRFGAWKRNHPNKQPTKNQMYRLAINSSHDTLKTRGAKGHWGRQKIRKMLLEGKGVVKKYEAK